MPQVAEYLLFVESTFRFHTTRHVVDETFANVDRFSKFVHQVIRKKILYVRITNISTSPALCCYTIL